MRIFIAVLVLALAVAEVQAQVGGVDNAPGAAHPFTARNQGLGGKGPPSKTKADEKAYQDALKRVPNKPYDPWQGAR